MGYMNCSHYDIREATSPLYIEGMGHQGDDTARESRG